MTEKVGGATQTFLLAALKEAQDNVRAYDTKAQIVGVGYIFAINIIVALGERILPGGLKPDIIVVVIAWVIIVVPIALFGAVLYPTRHVAPRLGTKVDAKGTYYLNPDRNWDVSTYLDTLKDCDLRQELAYELFKQSGLRDLKRKRFLRALMAAGLSFVLLFLGQVVRAEIQLIGG